MTLPRRKSLAHPGASSGINGGDVARGEGGVENRHFINLALEIVTGRLVGPIVKIVFTKSPITVVSLPGIGHRRVISRQNAIHIKAQPRARRQTPHHLVPVAVIESRSGISLLGS